MMPPSTHGAAALRLKLTAVVLVAFVALIMPRVVPVAGQQKPPDDPFKFSVSQPHIIPADIDEKALATVSSDAQLPQAQRLFDVFAWRVFVAVNWPARPNGQPDTTKTLADRTT